MLQLYKFLLDLPSQGIFPEVDTFLAEQAVDAKVVSFEDCGFSLFPYFSDLVDSFFRNDKVAGDNDCCGVETYGMGDSSYTGLVLA